MKKLNLLILLCLLSFGVISANAQSGLGGLKVFVKCGGIGNDGCRAWQTTLAWIRIGCPLPEVSDEPVKPLTLDSSMEEEERHPTGVALGFGTVH